MRFVNRNNMQNNKLISTIRPPLKNTIPKLKIRTEKLVPSLEQAPLRYNKIKSSQNIQQRHHPQIYRGQIDKHYYSAHQTKEPTTLTTSQTPSRLPQIYNPHPGSMKYFSAAKLNSKVRRSTAESLIEHRKHEQEKKQKQKAHKEQCKTEIASKAKTFKIKRIEDPKQLNRHQKQEVFRVIRTEFNELINASNSMSVRNKNNHFRAFIEKGNNGILVKEVLKKRWWWHLQSDPEKANLVWSQWFNKKVATKLKNIIVNETISVQNYEKKKYDLNMKSGAIKRLLDEKTFEKIENTISLLNNNYFKQYRAPASLRSSQNSSFFKMHIAEDDQIIHNHVEGCLNLHSKKLLFLNFYRFMIDKEWDPFQYIPLTFFIDSAVSPMIDKLYSKCEEISEDGKEQRNIWIVKPGQNSNRGNGIKVVGSRQELEKQINHRFPKDGSSSKRTVIVQKYLEKCFLFRINNRKFDIRCYLLVTTANGVLKGYWYRDGYIRTSSSEYSLENFEDQMIHLTNDAVQKKGSDFGKHEDHNKMGYDGFKQYLKKIGISEHKFDETYESMKQIAYYLMASVGNKLKRKQFTFELFGLDYMLDSKMHPFLIEANSNPCLENNGKILSKLIYELVDNVFMTAIDPIFPPPTNVGRKKSSDYVAKDYFESNKFELIFTGKTRLKAEESEE